MSLPRPVRVVGLGSPAGDDAVGWAAVDDLQKAIRKEGIEFHRVPGGQGLLDVLDGRGTLIVIDAARGDGSPGTIHRFDEFAGRLDVLRPGTTHGLGAAAALELAATLRLLPPRVVVFGMEAADLSPGAALSPAVTAALPELVRRVAVELNEGEAIEADQLSPSRSSSLS
jgi:hydrogenase maturation protease